MRLRRFGQSNHGDETRREEALIGAANLDAGGIPETGRPGAEDDSLKDALIIAGWGPVASALVRLGQLLDFTVTIVDPLLQISDLPPGVRLPEYPRLLSFATVLGEIWWS